MKAMDEAYMNMSWDEEPATAAMTTDPTGAGGDQGGAQGGDQGGD